jgi:acid stress-induced BolA-like protein IbaG/YrbA
MSTSIKDKVRAAVTASFADSRAVIELLKSGKVVVTVVSASFDGVPAAERKARVRAALTAGLADEDARLVINVLADTPDEHASMNATTPGESPLGE